MDMKVVCVLQKREVRSLRKGRMQVELLNLDRTANAESAALVLEGSFQFRHFQLGPQGAQGYGIHTAAIPAVSVGWELLSWIRSKVDIHDTALGHSAHSFSLPAD